MAMANLDSSDGWKFITPSGNQRRAPYTTLPTCGIKTMTSSTSEITNNQGAQRSQLETGICTTKIAATKPKIRPMM